MGQEACGEQAAAANNVLRLKYICVMMEVNSMKKSTKRFLSSALALLLMLSLPMTANAQVVVGADVPTATTTWEANSQPCVGTLWILDGYDYVSVPIKHASIVTVTNGERKTITWPQGNGAVQTPVFSAEPTLNDRTRMIGLLEELEYTMNSMTSYPSDPLMEFYQTPAGLPAGKYSYGAEFQVKTAQWMIERGQLLGRAVIVPVGADEGRIEGIPFSYTATKLIVVVED